MRPKEVLLNGVFLEGKGWFPSVFSCFIDWECKIYIKIKRFWVPGADGRKGKGHFLKGQGFPGTLLWVVFRLIYRLFYIRDGFEITLSLKALDKEQISKDKIYKK